jgi:hypothetical protein
MFSSLCDVPHPSHLHPFLLILNSFNSKFNCCVNVLQNFHIDTQIHAIFCTLLVKEIPQQLIWTNTFNYGSNFTIGLKFGGYPCFEEDFFLQG